MGYTKIKEEPETTNIQEIQDKVCHVWMYHNKTIAISRPYDMANIMSKYHLDFIIC